MKNLLISLSCLIAVGCASYGRDFDMNAVHNFVKNETSFAEVQAKLGKPISSSFAPDGTVVYGWSYTSATLGSSNAKSLMLKFSKSGKFEQVIANTQLSN